MNLEKFNSAFSLAFNAGNLDVQLRCQELGDLLREINDLRTENERLSADVKAEHLQYFNCASVLDAAQEHITRVEAQLAKAEVVCENLEIFDTYQQYLYLEDAIKALAAWRASKAAGEKGASPNQACGWIPVGKYLPYADKGSYQLVDYQPTAGPFWVIRKLGINELLSERYDKGWLFKDGVWKNEAGNRIFVTHWMFIPLLPGEKGGE